jgi:hypothetical protein
MWHDLGTEEEQILLNSVLKVEKVCIFGRVSGTVATICTAAHWHLVVLNQIEWK